MRKFLVLTAVVATTLGGMAVGPALAQAAVPTGTPALSQLLAVDAVVVANGVRLRSSAGGGTVIGYLYYGDYGLVLNPNSTSGWCNFRLGGRSASGLSAGTTGWVSCGYLAREDGLGVKAPAVDTLRE